MVMLTLGRRVPHLIRRELREIGEDLQKQTKSMATRS
jgi:hypothetical protein